METKRPLMHKPRIQSKINMIWNSRKGEFFLKKSFDSVIWCGLSSVFFSQTQWVSLIERSPVNGLHEVVISTSSYHCDNFWVRKKVIIRIFFKTLTDYTPFRWRLFRVSNISAMTTINTTKNTAAEDAAIIMTVGKELLLSSVITVVGMKTVVEDPGLNELVF